MCDCVTQLGIVSVIFALDSTHNSLVSLSQLLSTHIACFYHLTFDLALAQNLLVVSSKVKIIARGESLGTRLPASMTRMCNYVKRNLYSAAVHIIIHLTHNIIYYIVLLGI